jgi:hypothetical protein
MNKTTVYCCILFNDLGIWLEHNKRHETTGIVQRSKETMCCLYFSSPNAGLGRFHNGPGGHQNYVGSKVFLQLCVSIQFPMVV